MSSYLSFWIYDSRPRIKVFLCYVLLFLIVFAFSDIMIYLYTKSLYQPIENYEINIEKPQLTINTAEASNVNGYIKGTIKNTTQEKITDKYIRFDFYTPREVNVGTKYLKINDLTENEEIQFELGFKYDNVSNVKISIASDDDTLKATPEELETTNTYGPAGMLQLFLLSRLFA